MGTMTEITKEENFLPILPNFSVPAFQLSVTLMEQLFQETLR